MRVFIIVMALGLSGMVAQGQVTKPKTPVKTNTVTKTINANGYTVNAVITPYKNCWMYLGTYYGKNKILVDSAWFNNNSEATFKGDKK